MISPPADFSRLCIHTITTKPWELEEAVARYSAAGVGGITVWRDAVGGRDLAGAGRMIREHGLALVSLCRGGVFRRLVPGGAREAARGMRIRSVRIDDAAALGAPLGYTVPWFAVRGPDNPSPNRAGKSPTG